MPTVNLDIWIDAWTSWGIGLSMGMSWAAWHLLPGWKSTTTSVGPNECISLQLAVMYLCETGARTYCEVTIRSDNANVISAFWQSAMLRNDAVRQLTLYLSHSNLTNLLFSLPQKCSCFMD